MAFFECSTFAYVMVSSPPKLRGGTFWFSKKILSAPWSFFILRGRSPYEESYQNRLTIKGDSNIKTWILYLFFLLSFSQFSKIVYLCNTDCAFICLYYYIGTLSFRNFNMTKEQFMCIIFSNDNGMITC